MVHVREVFDLHAELQRDGEPADDVARLPGDDVDPKHAPCLAVEDDLEQPVLRLDVLRTRYRGQRVRGDTDLEALFDRF